jgi:hypothetical protein
VYGGGLLKAAFLLLLLLFSSRCALADTPGTTVVDATGVAVVSGDNTALARDSAIGDALRKAVEQAIGTMVSSETMVANYQVLSDNVYTNTQGYIKSYDVVKEWQGGGLYQVLVRAVVQTDPLKDDLSALGVLQMKAGRPKVLFLIAEKNIGQKYYHFWWWGKSEYKGETVDISAAETAMKEAFVTNGFTVVDTGRPEDISVSDAYRVSDLSAAEAKEIGRAVNAEVVVYGKAVAKERTAPEGTTSMPVYLADVTAQAVRVDDGVVLAVAGGHGASRNISDISGGTEAITRASQELSGKLIDQITARWTAGVNLVTITLNGINDYQKLVEFKNALKGRVRGVAAVYQRKYSDGEAVFEVETKASAQDIADDISRMAGYFKVVKTTPNMIYVEAGSER